MFIGYVNKLRSNFRHLQTHVLITLFKAYCCSFYGSQLWKFNSVGIDKCCKSWNIAVRTLLGLPYNAHTYLLGPISGVVGRERMGTAFPHKKLSGNGVPTRELLRDIFLLAIFHYRHVITFSGPETISKPDIRIYKVLAH